MPRPVFYFLFFIYLYLPIYAHNQALLTCMVYGGYYTSIYHSKKFAGTVLHILATRLYTYRLLFVFALMHLQSRQLALKRRVEVKTTRVIYSSIRVLPSM